MDVSVYVRLCEWSLMCQTVSHGELASLCECSGVCCDCASVVADPGRSACIERELSTSNATLAVA